MEEPSVLKVVIATKEKIMHLRLDLLCEDYEDKQTEQYITDALNYMSLAYTALQRAIAKCPGDTN
jgi:hypothetical protein